MLSCLLRALLNTACNCLTIYSLLQVHTLPSNRAKSWLSTKRGSCSHAAGRLSAVQLHSTWLHTCIRNESRGTRTNRAKRQNLPATWPSLGPEPCWSKHHDTLIMRWRWCWRADVIHDANFSFPKKENPEKGCAQLEETALKLLGCWSSMYGAVWYTVVHWCAVGWGGVAHRGMWRCVVGQGLGVVHNKQ